VVPREAAPGVLVDLHDGFGQVLLLLDALALDVLSLLTLLFLTTTLALQRRQRSNSTLMRFDSL